MTSATAAALGASLLLGSIPFGLLVAKAWGVSELREKGSGNIGATNVARVVGRWAGLATLLLDAGKGAAAAAICRPEVVDAWTSWVGFGADGSAQGGEGTGLPWTGAFATVFGHCFSPWLRFQGGKGVATGFGAIVVLSPVAAAVGAAAFALTFGQGRIGSLSSLLGLFSAAAAQLILEPVGPHLWGGAALATVILLRHEENVDALLASRERAF